MNVSNLSQFGLFLITHCMYEVESIQHLSYMLVFKACLALLLSSQGRWVQIQAPFLSSCVTLQKLFNSLLTSVFFICKMGIVIFLPLRIILRIKSKMTYKEPST